MNVVLGLGNKSPRVICQVFATRAARRYTSRGTWRINSEQHTQISTAYIHNKCSNESNPPLSTFLLSFVLHTMKQLYILGIAVAAILLLLLGLSKLSQSPAANIVPETDTDAPEMADVNEVDESSVEVENSTSEALEIEADPSPETVTTNESETMDSPTYTENTTVVMQTNKGDITIELFTEDMPITAGNFLKLAQEDYYDGIKFHRIIDGFMIQGGDPLTKDDSMQARWGTGGPGYAIEDEFVPGYSNVRGTLSMANSGPNSGGSQFFINTVDNVMLDYDKQPLTSKHPVFGRVIDGMDVVDAISGVETGMRDVPVEPVIIEDIVVR